MREVLQRLNDASAATVALAEREHQLSEAELDQVAAAGGKAGASTNPVED
jgi:hypothetical protein